jgi:DinB superfamily
MKSLRLLTVALLVLPAACAPQKPAPPPAPPTNPVAEAARNRNASMEKNLVAAAEAVPATKLAYKPTAKQMTFGEIWHHLAMANYGICGAIGGMTGPDVGKYNPKAKKDTLVAALKGSFAFCDKALAGLADSTLNNQVDLGFMKASQAMALDIYLMDLADHYSQVANYMRLNRMLPPTAQKKGE